ncbi:MAG: segregation and condensation protein A [Gammaproteobacteria bacterium]|nr:MAG: segregation and condensation protein A [Gammaproteobacteria bacterium]
MTTAKLNKEQKILLIVRKTLAQIAIDTAPKSGQKSPLSPVCIENMKQCFDLISSREKELNANQNPPKYPIYQDNKAQPINFIKK